MIKKIISSIFFIAVVWWGMTHTGKNPTNTEQQSSAYANRHRSLNIRFFAISSDEKLAATYPATRGVTQLENSSGTVEFVVSNSGKKAQTIATDIQLTPEIAKEYITITSIVTAENPVRPGLSTPVIVNFKLLQIPPDSADTIRLTLRLSKIGKVYSQP